MQSSQGDPSMRELHTLAQLLTKRNRLDQAIAAVIGRPAIQGHIGEFIASRVFGIRLMPSASNKAFDGQFVGGPLDGRSVDIKLYGKFNYRSHHRQCCSLYPLTGGCAPL